MLAEERRRRIMEKIHRTGSVEMSSLADELNVSTETLRRDLTLLEKQNLLKRTHGGAIAPSRMTYAKALSERLEQFGEKKHALSELALDFVCEGDSIAIDTGSTAVAFVKALMPRFHRLTVVTHSADVLNLLRDAPQIQTILCGGYYLPSENAFWGELTLATLRELHVNKAFIFPSAISLQNGAMDFNYSLLEVQKAYLNIADQVYFLADSSKFETNAQLKIAPLLPEYTLITDAELSADIARAYRNEGLQLLQAKS